MMFSYIGRKEMYYCKICSCHC